MTRLLKSWRTIAVLMGLISGDVSAGGDHWEVARETCGRMVARLATLSLDPDHQRILSPLNRFMATHKVAFHTELRREHGQETEQAQELGTLVGTYDHPAELAYIPSEILKEVLLSLAAARGRLGWTGDDHSHFSIQPDGTPIICLGIGKRDPFSLLHEADHFMYWLELKTILEKEMSSLAAAHFALHLIDTPEGTWIAENRAMAVQLAAVQKYGYIKKPPRGGRRYLANDLLHDSNYPAQIALEHAFFYRVLFGEKFVERHPQYQTEVEQVQRKIRQDMDRIMDAALEATLDEYQLQALSQGRQNSGVPIYLAQVFGPPSAELLARQFEADQLELMRRRLAAYLERHPERVPTANPPKVDPPKRRWRWWPF